MNTLERMWTERIEQAMDVIDTLPVMQAFPILKAMCILDVSIVVHPRLLAWMNAHGREVAAFYKPGRPQ